MPESHFDGPESHFDGPASDFDGPASDFDGLPHFGGAESGLPLGSGHLDSIVAVTRQLSILSYPIRAGRRSMDRVIHIHAPSHLLNLVSHPLSNQTSTGSQFIRAVLPA